MSGPDLLSVFWMVGVCAIVGAGLGAGALHLARARSLRVALAIVTLAPLLVAVTGALLASRAMFIDGHVLDVLTIVLTTSTAVGSVIALLLGRWVTSAAAALVKGARAQTETGYSPVARLLPREFADIDAALSEGSAALHRAQDRERALERGRRELVAWISHDLRTPIAGIRAMSEALAEGVVDDRETTLRYAGSIQHEAERLSALVDDLFELSRIHAEVLRTSVGPVALWDVLSEGLDSARPIAAAKGVRLEGEAVSLPLIAGSAPDLLRVVRNLLANAIRHTPTDGVIALRAGADEGDAWFEVADACGGIPDADLPRVFDVAFRGSQARTPGEDIGGGLGLAIARGLVEAHGGEISVHNSGPGCRVLVRIPAPVHG